MATLAAELSQTASGDRERARLAQSLVTFVAVILPIGRIQELVGTGLKTVEALSPSSAPAGGTLNPAFSAVVIALGLSSVGWSGFGQFVMPAVIRSTTDILSQEGSAETEAALDLLAALHEQNQLVYTLHAAATPALARWRTSISRVVLSQLRDLADALDAGAQLDVLEARASSDASALRLVSLFPDEAAGAATQLRRITNLLVAKDPRETYDSSAYNEAALLASALNAFSDLLDAARSAGAAAALLGDLLADDGALAEACLAYAWHRTALSAFARLYRCARSMNVKNASPPALNRLAPALQDAVMSSDDVLRSAAVELLSLASASASTSLAAMPSRIAEIERIGLGVESVRDRNVRTRALARDLVRAAEANAKEASLSVVAELVIRFVVGTCKLNFRPLWDESRAALVELATRFGEDVWRIAFSELQHAAPLPAAPVNWQRSELDELEADSDVLDSAADEQSTDARAEKHFIDPQLSARCAIIKARLDASRRGAAGRQTATLRTLAREQTPEGRLDVLNYTTQILKTFGDLTILVERHNAPLMEHFFAAIRDDRVHDEDDEADAPEEEASRVAATEGGVRLTLRERRARLCAYLELFSRFSNPKALLRSEELHSYLYSLCATGDEKVQKLALDCVLSWKDPAQVPYKARLHTLLDAPRFRDELTALNLSPDGDTIQPGHRARLMPLLLRLLFGLMISRRGRSSSAAGQGARKAAILAALRGCDSGDLRTLVDLMLAPFAEQVPTSAGTFTFSETACTASARRQSGFISLLADVIKHLGLVTVPLWPLLIGTTLNLARHADLAARASRGKATLGLRALRQAAIRRIAEFFRQPTTAFDWEPFLPALFSGLVSPRLSLLSSESVQSPSALLELFHTWTGRADTAPYLVRFDATLLPNVYACLAAPTAKPPVISCILELLERLLSADNDALAGDAAAADIRSVVVRPHISPLLAGMTPLLRRYASAGGIDRARDELMRRQIRILADVGPLVTEAGDASALLELLGPMLRKSNHVIPERTKTDLLQIFCDLLLLTPEFQDPTSETFSRHYALFSGAFSMLRSRPARTTLGGLFRQFSKIDPSLVRVAGWLEALNSFSTKRMEEPDFDRRLAAFDELNDERALPDPPLSPAEWLPIVHNMLFFIQDTEELAFRTNAGLSLRCFVVATESCCDAEQTTKMRELFHNVVYPGLRKCLRSRSELVRREVLSVLGTAVQHLGHCFETLGEMRGLLADGDEEANFFNNIHHIQVHRRSRALRRLGDQAAQGTLRSKAIAEIFAPLVTHFLQSGNVELHDHNLVNETIACLGRLARQMVWGAYNALLWRFLKLANEASAAQKVFVRAAMALLDAFHFDMNAQAQLETADDGREEEMDDEGKPVDPAAVDSLPVAEEQSAEKEAARAAAKSTKILDAVTGRLLPALMGYLEQKDESDDAVRLPVAVGVVRVVQRLPTHVKETHIRKLLNTLAKVLKSKSQETRDLARDTLAKVATALGASYFPDMLRELRRALVRGPQLAVLAFTVHTLLVHLTTMAESPLTLLDAGIDDVVHVATEDVFGHTSEDRVGIESRTKMREMRQSKSLDTFEQLARIAAPARISALLLPLRDIMQQTEAHKAIVSVEDVLRRIASGINANVHLDAATFLVLCHSLISRNAVFLQPRATAGEGRKGKSLLGYRFAVHMKRADVEAGLSAQDHYARNAHRFVVFGLDLLIVAMRRARFDFHSADTLARLDPLVSVVGNTLYASDASVVNAGLKGVSALVKCPLPALETALPVYIKQILAAIHREGSAQSDIAQAALKALTSILREAKSAHFKDRQLGDLLSLVVVDIEEPGAQSAIFALLRAVIARRLVVPEVYDIMDRVAEMLVTNQSAQVRDTCRAAFLQFLLDFPQGKQRLRNQVRFLAKNVSYDFESGRLSVMELLSAVLTKFDDGVLREHADVLFVSLVMALANDDSALCRAQAASLIKMLISVVEVDHRARLAQLTHSWAEQSERSELARVAMQVYSLMLEAAPENASAWASRALVAASSCLADAASALVELESDQFFDPMDVDGGLDWQLPYQALQTVEGLHAHVAALVDARGSAATWSSVRELLLFPHAWVRLGASRLLGLLFSPVDPLRPAAGKALEESPFSLESLIDIARKLTLQLRAPRIDEGASTQAVKNLLYIGRCFALCPAPSHARTASPAQADESDAEDEDDEGVDAARGVQENPLAWLFTKLSYTARAAQLARADMQVSANLQPLAHSI
jgi:U3 small nucleolar RNA-associated protein 20